MNHREENCWSLEENAWKRPQNWGQQGRRTQGNDATTRRIQNGQGGQNGGQEPGQQQGNNNQRGGYQGPPRSQVPAYVAWNEGGQDQRLIGTESAGQQMMEMQPR